MKFGWKRLRTPLQELRFGLGKKVEDGNFGDHHSLGDGVSELRINFGPGYRVYYGLDGKVMVLLLFAGDKGSQDKDVKKAKIYWLDYQTRR